MTKRAPLRRTIGDARPKKHPPPRFAPFGSFLGYELHSFGNIYDRSDSDPEVRGQQLASLVSRFSVDSIMNGIAGFTAESERDAAGQRSRLERAGINPHSLGRFLLRRLVDEVLLRHDALTAIDRPDMDTGSFLAALRYVMDYQAASDQLIRSATGESPTQVVMRILQAQIHDQLGLEAYLREVWLTERTVELARARGLDMESAYRSELGISYSDLSMLCFAAYSAVTESGAVGIDGQRSIEAAESLGVTVAAARTFFEVCALDFGAYRAKVRDKGVTVRGYEPYALSPLSMWPLLKTNDGMFLAPIITDTLERVSRAFAVEGPRFARAIGGRPAESVLNGCVGDTYEEYVHEMLTHGSSQPVIRAAKIVPADTKQCDFVLMDSEVAMLVEVKSVRLRLSALTTRDALILREELSRENGILDGLLQILTTAQTIKSGRGGLPKRTILCGLLVVRGEQICMNTAFVRKMLDELVIERTGKRPIIRYQLANDIDLEAIVSVGRAGRPMGKWVYEKDSDLKREGQPVRDYDPFRLAYLEGVVSGSPLITKFADAHEGLLSRTGVTFDGETVASSVDLLDTTIT